VPPTIKGPNRPTCSVRSTPNAEAGAALVLPACNTEAMQLHLDAIATKITPGAHPILLLDQAGWLGAKALKVPSNISLFRHARPNSTAKKISGNSCGRTGCRTEFSNLSTTSSITAATPETPSSTSRRKSCPSPRLGSHRSLNLRIGISHRGHRLAIRHRGESRPSALP
jgi:hypothetical protein